MLATYLPLAMDLLGILDGIQGMVLVYTARKDPLQSIVPRNEYAHKEGHMQSVRVVYDGVTRPRRQTSVSSDTDSFHKADQMCQAFKN